MLEASQRRGRETFAGCAGCSGIFCLPIGLAMFFDPDPDSLSAAIMFSCWGALSLLAAATALRTGRASATVVDRPLTDEERERLILRVAAAHEGRVTPTLAALASPRLTIVEARTTLERLAAEGFCGLDSDDQGNLYYVFPLVDEPRERLRSGAAETEWERLRD